ncbi:MAG: hypothetical protein ACE5LH_04420, partial [Fidelibacterota bacterium]
MGSAAVQNVGVLSVETGNLQQGIPPGTKQLAVSISTTTVRMKRINSVVVDTSQTIRSAILSGGIGITRGLSLWGQIPFTESNRSGSWLAGDPAIGFRWTPLVKAGSSFSFSINDGIILPLAQGLKDDPGLPRASGVGQDRALPGTGVFLNRTVAEGWVFTQTLRLFGIQLLLDLPVTQGRDGFSPGRAFQVGLHSIDRRFTWRGIIPFLSLTYRREGADQLDGDVLANSSGWFIYLAGAMDIRLSSRYRLTLTASTPLVNGMDGTDLDQASGG